MFFFELAIGSIMAWLCRPVTAGLVTETLYVGYVWHWIPPTFRNSWSWGCYCSWLQPYLLMLKVCEHLCDCCYCSNCSLICFLFCLFFQFGCLFADKFLDLKSLIEKFWILIQDIYRLLLYGKMFQIYFIKSIAFVYDSYFTMLGAVQIEMLVKHQDVIQRNCGAAQHQLILSLEGNQQIWIEQ